jgi:hypothetical protein
MYNSHRGIPPGPPPPQPNRVAELLDQVRAEFEAQIGRTNDTEHHRKWIPCTKRASHESGTRPRHIGHCGRTSRQCARSCR